MNKTAQIEMHRLFLVGGLPDPLTAASSHLQIFDNYISNTRLRLRKIRNPYANEWTRILQHRSHIEEGSWAVVKLAEIYLDDAEYKLFQPYEGRELRKNRYFHEFDDVSVAFDVYLGSLLGLTIAKFDFEDRDRMEDFAAPPFASIEITNDPFFAGENLVDRTFADIQAALAPHT